MGARLRGRRICRVDQKARILTAPAVSEAPMPCRAPRQSRPAANRTSGDSFLPALVSRQSPLQPPAGWRAIFLFERLVDRQHAAAGLLVARRSQRPGIRHRHTRRPNSRACKLLETRRTASFCLSASRGSCRKWQILDRSDTITGPAAGRYSAIRGFVSPGAP